MHVMNSEWALSSWAECHAWSALQFGRLERVEVGGTKGKALTNAIKQVHADFLVAHGKFQEVGRDPFKSQLNCACNNWACLATVYFLDFGFTTANAMQ